MKRRKKLSILLSVVTLTAQGQTILDATHNQTRAYDELLLRSVSMTLPIKQTEEEFCIDLSDAEFGDQKVARTFSLDILPDTMTAITLGTRSYYITHGDSTLLVGMENNQLRIIYDLPELWIRFPMTLGDSLAGYYNGVGQYCDELFIRKYGTYSTKANGIGIIVLPNGEPVRNVLRITTDRLLSTIATPIDTLRREIPQFTVDSIRQHLATDTALMRETICRYYAPGYRYPILEVSSLRDGLQPTTAPFYTSTYFLSPETQEQLALDDENKAVRARLAAERSAGYASAEIGGSSVSSDSSSFAGGSGNGLRYTIAQSDDSRQITIDCSHSHPAKAEAILANSQGYVFKTASQSSDSDTGNTLRLSCDGLHSGQYILYISIDGERFAEKVNLR